MHGARRQGLLQGVLHTCLSSQALAEHCLHLQSLDLSHCTNFSQRALEATLGAMLGRQRSARSAPLVRLNLSHMQASLQ